MNGVDFLTLAGRLIATPVGGAELSAARCRSAVSRAYYGAYLCAIQTLKELGATVPRNHTAHEEATKLLRATGHPEAAMAAGFLNDLRADRNEADYDLHRGRLESNENARGCVEYAEDARKSLAQCLVEPARSSLKAYFASRTQPSQDL